MSQMPKDNTSVRNKMLEKLKKFANELRKRGFAVEVGHSEDEKTERYFIDIILDKTKHKGNDFYE